MNPRFNSKIFDYLKDFYLEYFNDQLELGKSLPIVITLDTTFDQLGFAAEELDDFVSGYENRFSVDVSEFYLNLHIEGLYYNFLIVFASLLSPIIGIKKWMVFNKKERVSLTTGDLIEGLDRGQLSSEIIYKSKIRTDRQEKIYQYLKNQ